MPVLPRITIITPSYNQGAYIEQTISSVLDQDYPDLEYIVMDGGSTDQTLELLRKYESRLIWVSEPDRGQSHAINKGMARATGEVIGYLNSDDQLMPGALLKVGGFFQDHPEAFWITGKCRTVNDANQDIRKPITLYKNFWLSTRSSAPLSVLNYIYQPATFWRKGAVEQVGYFDESRYYAMDYDYWLRLRKHFRLWFLDDNLACFRVHATSKGVTSAPAHFEDDLAVARAHITSRPLLKLHQIHNVLIVSVYRLLSTKLQRGAASR